MAAGTVGIGVAVGGMSMAAEARDHETILRIPVSIRAMGMAGYTILPAIIRAALMIRSAHVTGHRISRRIGEITVAGNTNTAALGATAVIVRVCAGDRSENDRSGRNAQRKSQYHGLLNAVQIAAAVGIVTLGAFQLKGFFRTVGEIFVGMRGDNRRRGGNATAIVTTVTEGVALVG